jgi:hypothetical protein
VEERMSGLKHKVDELSHSSSNKSIRNHEQNSKDLRDTIKSPNL